MSDQRALLDECTTRKTCTAQQHLSDCLASPTVNLLAALQRSVDAARAERRDRDPDVLSDRAAEAILGLVEADRELRDTEDLQRWERRIGGTDIAAEHLTVAVGDGDGTARIQESVLAQLLVDAGWERTA